MQSYDFLNALSRNVHARSLGKTRRALLLCLGICLVFLCFGHRASGQSLQVTYGAKGVQTISFNGVVLEDAGSNPGDAFHIWHMKATDLQGNARTDGQSGWGEINNGTNWNSATNTETYFYNWGSIKTQFVQQGNTLNMIVTEANNAGSGEIFDGAEIYPFALHFPQNPKNFNGYSQFAITTTGPGVSVADFGSGVVTSVIPDESQPLYGGWKNTGTNTYTPLMTSTAPDGLASFFPRNDRPVQPGTTFTYTVSLRFTPEGTAADVTDAYRSFAATYPSQMTWTDRRIIGTAYLASSPANTNGKTQSGGFPTNPRRYFNDPSVDITTPSGLQSFQKRMLAQAAANVTNAQAMNAQGVITWDIEGEQYPQDTTYVCSPDQIAAVAPEMESVITNPGSAYAGQKLDDAYFKTMTSAGLKVGVCLRPQQFVLAPDGTASQSFLSGNSAIIATLEKKAKAANSRWGVTLFYVDSTVDVNGGTLDPAIFQQLITDMPGFLFIPEESTPRYYAYSAPFYTFLFHTDLGTNPAVYNYYPKAFGMNLVNDVSPSTLATYTPQLTASVMKGDILAGHADYWQANDSTLVTIYQAAGVSSPAPVQVTPAITWAAPSAVSYGTALNSTQLNAVANTAGTFVYSPAAGSVLSAGTQSLMVTFTPADTANYTSATAAVNITVNQAVPTIAWPVPAAITQGAALSAAQLDATATVGGTFTYSPAAGTVLGAGTQTLQATFTPADSTDYSTAKSTVALLVNAAPVAAPVTPQIAWAAPGAITYGTPLGSAQLNAASNTAGTFVYSPAAGTILSAGVTKLQVTFLPANTTAYKTVTVCVTLTVVKGRPVVTWSVPSSIVSGTALGGTQLNAIANVPGTFIYSPSAGTVLSTGAQTLNVTFTPTDTADYVSASASVSLSVNAAVPVMSGPLFISSPGTGTSLSGVTIIVGQCSLPLDAAGTFLIVDGQWLQWIRASSWPFLYTLDTRFLANGAHTLQLWGHDIGNNTTISPGVSITVAN